MQSVETPPSATTARRSRVIQIIIGLLLTLGVANLPLGTWGSHLTHGSLAGREMFWWIAVAVVLLYVTVIERRRLRSIGFRRPRVLDVLLAIVAGALLVAGIVVIYSFVFPLLHLHMNAAEGARLMATPWIYRFFLVTRAAFSEEILFRGYPIERLQELTGSRIAAGVISWAAFTIAHLSGWGWAQLIVAGYGGVILTVLYLWRRNLWANIIAHWIGDGAGFLFS
jgi:membrane protease YdiL (CAAX protease family)